MSGSVTTWGFYTGNAETPWNLVHYEFDSFVVSEQFYDDITSEKLLPVVWQGSFRNEGATSTYTMAGSTYDPNLRRYITYASTSRSTNRYAYSEPDGKNWVDHYLLDPAVGIATGAAELPYSVVSSIAYAGTRGYLNLGTISSVQSDWYGSEIAQYNRSGYSYALGNLGFTALSAAATAPLAIRAYGYSAGFFGLTATNATFGAGGLYGLGLRPTYQTYQHWDRLSGPERLLAVGSPVASLVGGSIGAALIPRSVLYSSALSGALARGYINNSMLTSTARLTAGYPAGNVAPVSSMGTVRVFRVQGGTPPTASRRLVHINDEQNVSITRTTLNISAVSPEHARYFQGRRPSAGIAAFEIPGWLFDFIHEQSIPQLRYSANINNQGGLAPKLVDPTTLGLSYELPSVRARWLEEYAVPGSGHFLP